VCVYNYTPGCSIEYVFRWPVCVTAGYLVSFWDRPFFPDWCSDHTLDDSATYDTMVRIAGSWAGVSRAFKAIADHYGWTHIVLVSDDQDWTVCAYGSKPFDELFGHNANYTFTWLRFSSKPTDEQLDDLLHHIRQRTRGVSIRY